jgi:hypothetical protein
MRNFQACIRRRIGRVYSLASRCQLCREPQFDVALSGDEKAAWNAFRHVATDDLRNVKAVNFRNLWRIL